ncbi:DUF2164 domain-containing protein [Pseudomonas sp. SBB6]|uniref:DUF2164 domain-containing protein n=1 Tax=Pseudomonas sp. SBB6 TaxID=2962032 RepID=UPI0020B85937|nr:DUF2164 family protein [Pseudomonas sp. SBB6]MCP3750483.1 DUF2164 domain-containing protein [Pseudomonas sp. SBB6]
MSKINVSTADQVHIREQLKHYCLSQFDLHLGQFDADFFADFISKQIGPIFFNAGIEEAIRTHAFFSERIQEEIDLKRIL